MAVHSLIFFAMDSFSLYAVAKMAKQGLNPKYHGNAVEADANHAKDEFSQVIGGIQVKPTGSVKDTE